MRRAMAVIPTPTVSEKKDAEEFLRVSGAPGAPKLFRAWVYFCVTLTTKYRNVPGTSVNQCGTPAGTMITSPLVR